MSNSTAYILEKGAYVSCCVCELSKIGRSLKFLAYYKTGEKKPFRPDKFKLSSGFVKMLERTVKVSSPWIWYNDESKTATQKFFEAYVKAVDTGNFLDYPMTKWYAPSTAFRSETGKVFYGAEEMHEWMKDLFFRFEKVSHVPQTYLEYDNDDGSASLHAEARRRLWVKGNTSEKPDVHAF